MPLVPFSDADVIDRLSDREVVGLTIYGEARGLSEEGRIAVASAILNRVRSHHFGVTARAVCLKPWQFSCWRPQDGKENYETVMAAAHELLQPKPKVGITLRECLNIAALVVADTLVDTVQNSVFYVTKQLWQSKPPKHLVGRTPTCQVGSHVFFTQSA